MKLASISATHVKFPQSYWHFCASTLTYIKDRRAHPILHRIWPQIVAVDRMSRDQLLDLQQTRLKNLLEDVVRHVPYYQRWSAGVGWKEGDALRLGDFPVVTKETFRAEGDAFRHRGFSASVLNRGRTSGSSGEPFSFLQDRRAGDHSYACLWRALGRHGIRPGMRRGYIWGRSYQFNQDAAAVQRTRRRHRLRSFLNKTLQLDAYSLSDGNVDAAIEQLELFRPLYLHGYVSALYTLARRLQSLGRTFTFKLRAVFTESERLYPFQRQAMEQVWGCPIHEHYGSVEIGNMAEADPEGRLRINEDFCVLEVLSSGEGLATNLFSNAYPFIRYRQGDIIKLGSGAAGPLPYAVLEQVIGRTVDLIPVSRGGFVHGVALAHVIDPHLAIVRKFQVRQQALGRFLVRVVVSEPLSTQVRQCIERGFRLVAGQDVLVTIEEVDNIAPDPSGKFRVVVSEISGPTGQILPESHPT